MRYVTTITLSVALGALALSSCQSDRLPSEPAVAPTASFGAAADQVTVTGSAAFTLPFWYDRWEWTKGDVEVAKKFGSPMIFWGDIVGEGSYTSNLAYKHQYAEDGSHTLTGQGSGKITLAVSEFLGEPVTGTLDGTLHYQVIQNWVLGMKLVLHGTGDLDGYSVQLTFPAGPWGASGDTYTGTVFGPAVH